MPDPVRIPDTEGDLKIERQFRESRGVITFSIVHPVSHYHA
jgi:hypothetical protein